MTTKAQVTVFIILGLVIIVSAAGALYMYSTRNVLVDVKDKPITTVEEGVRSCLEEKLELAIFHVAAQGGILIADNLTLVLESRDVRYHLFGGKKTIPTKESIELAIAEYLKRSLPLCANSILEQFGGTQQTVNLESTASITANGVVATLNYPLKYSKGETIQTVGTLTARSQAPLLELLSTVETIISKTLEQPTRLDLGMLATLPFQTTVYPLGTETLIYSLEDEKTITGNRTLQYIFAVQVPTLATPKLDNIPGFTIKKGNTLTYTAKLLEGNGNLVRFTLPKGSGSVDEKTGVYTYTAQALGEQEATLCAVLVAGIEDCETFTITVTND